MLHTQFPGPVLQSAAHVAVTDEHDLGVVAVVQDAGAASSSFADPSPKRPGNTPMNPIETMTLSWQRMG